LYEVPDQIPANSKLSVNADWVSERLKDIIEDKDLSQYIL
jgi:ATP-dependent protease HslVU (ClpYQ) ATPase subunit